MTRLIKFLAAIYMIGSILFYSKIIQFDNNVSLFLIQGDKSKAKLILNDMPVYKPVAETAVSLINDPDFPKNCDNLMFLSNRLREINSRSPYAYFMSGACKEINGDFQGAYDDVKKASEFEMYNPDYLFSLAVLAYKLENRSELISLVNKIRDVNPSDKNLRILEELLSVKSQPKKQ